VKNNNESSIMIFHVVKKIAAEMLETIFQSEEVPPVEPSCPKQSLHGQMLPLHHTPRTKAYF
jgi:hypothetical protein